MGDVSGRGGGPQGILVEDLALCHTVPINVFPVKMDGKTYCLATTYRKNRRRL